MSEYKKDIKIPTVWSRRPRAERDLPISERENLLRALNHEKPLWMPNLYAATQFPPLACIGELPENSTEDGYDWFGIPYVYTESVGSNTPKEGIMSEIGEWREKTPWPDLKKWDRKKGFETFKRDGNLALGLPWGNGMFERLHGLFGFEQALVDLLVEPAECRAFLERLADFKTEVFHMADEVYDFDFVTYFDDWGTEKGTFFSAKLLEETLLVPTKRVVDAVKANGTKFIFHSCGLVNSFVPYYVDAIGADALEIQRINDVAGIVKKYGDRVTVEYRPDPHFMYDPDTTPEQARLCARDLVDALGAHTNPGAGVVLSPIALRDEVYYAFDDEVFRYSLEKYRAL
jgi:hypothetical protein